MTKFIAISNRRGGVGKSTLTLMLACGLASQKKSVLVVDLDPQCSTTNVFLKPDIWQQRLANDRTIAGYLRRVITPAQNGSAAQYISEDGVHQLKATRRFFRAGLQSSAPLRIIPCSPDLDDREMDILLSVFGRNIGLTAALDDTRLRTKEAILALGPGHDYVIVDCPPGLSHIVWGALAAVDGILIPYLADRTAELNVKWLLSRLDKYQINAKRVTVANRYTGRDNQNGILLAVQEQCPGFSDFHLPRSVAIERSLELPAGAFTLEDRFAGARQTVLALTAKVLDWLPTPETSNV